MKTTCFAGCREPGRISIARRAPANMVTKVQHYPALAPGSWFKSVSPRQYVRLYFGEVLSKLDPRQVWEDLHQLVAPHEPVLLCWEKPPLTPHGRWWERPVSADAGEPSWNWCHRTMTAAWLQDRLGVTIDEWHASSALDSNHQLL